MAMAIKRTGGAASAAGLRADGHGHERKDQASERKCQAAVKFDARFEPAWAVICYQSCEANALEC